MQCMKCGRDIEAGQVFCPECLADMEKYPVKPGTVVLLPPSRPVQSLPKKAPVRRRAGLSLEEQVNLLKRLTRSLAAILVLAILVASALGYFAVKTYLDNENKLLPGQNYSVIGSQTTDPTTEPAGFALGE